MGCEWLWHWLETEKMSHIMAKYLVKCHLLYLEGGPRTWRAAIERDFGKQDIGGLLLLAIFTKRWACRRIGWSARINKRGPVQKLVSREWTKPTTVSKPKQWGRLDYSVIHCPSPKRICFSGAPILGLATWLALANRKWGAVWYLPLLNQCVVAPIVVFHLSWNHSWQLRITSIWMRRTLGQSVCKWYEMWGI